MTDHDLDDATGPEETELLKEIAAVVANPTEEGVKRLIALAFDEGVPAMVRVRASARLLDIGYGPADEGDPDDEDEP